MFKNFNKIETTLIQESMKIAYNAHHGQLDKAGVPFIFHPITVATIALKNANLYLNQTMCCIVFCVSLLHDVVEDTTCTIEDIKELLFAAVRNIDIDEKYIEKICDALKCLTRNKKEKYSDYIQRVETNYFARIVKLADLTHNMDTNRLDVLTSKDIERLNKYNSANEYLNFINLLPEKYSEDHDNLIEKLRMYD